MLLEIIRPNRSYVNPAAALFSVCSRRENPVSSLTIEKQMARPTFLVAEPRPDEGISARKLVLETALFNVITAYDGPEALELLAKYPEVEAVVVHSGLGAAHYRQIIAAAVAQRPDRLVVLVSPGNHAKDPAAHHHLSSHDPKHLLNLAIDRFGYQS